MFCGSTCAVSFFGSRSGYFPDTVGATEQQPRLRVFKRCPKRGTLAQRTLPYMSTDDDETRPENDISGSILPRGALFGGFLSRGAGRKRARVDRVPQQSDVPCACGSGRTYQHCCMPVHLGSRVPPEADELLRARYSAFAYRLPAFIMRTTSKTNPDYTDDWNRWEADILEFCDTYRFPGMEILDEKRASPDVCFIQFRANLIYEGMLGFFIERSRFAKERGKWMYASGKLVEAEMPPR
ncbi:hypothetical protein CCYA_CCYA15G3901 [Cyanidiococcus yangmingshanensis]|nr:hypothetical protein CCYA_CCYA15G3901 [Cyanidiococcus yangmingshanensis]